MSPKSPPQPQTPTPFTVPQSPKEIQCLRYGNSKAHLIFTHGAGGTLTSPAISHFASGFATVSPTVTFQGNSNLKSRAKSFSAVIEHESFATCLGGRSMGARAAVLSVTPETEKLILVSYPLKGGEERAKILVDLRGDVEVLFIIGESDELCDLERLERVREEMKCKSWLIVVKGADHGMGVKPKRASQEVVERTGQAAAEWIKNRAAETECEIYFDGEEGVVRQSEWSTGSASNVTDHQKMEATSKRATKAPSKKRGSKEPPVPISNEDQVETRSSKRRKGRS